MPELVSLDTAKSFLRVSSADDDLMIAAMIRTASEAALSFADGLTEAQLADLPERVRTAVLVHVAALYDQRDNPVVPSAVLGLLQPFRSYGAG